MCVCCEGGFAPITTSVEGEPLTIALCWHWPVSPSFTSIMVPSGAQCTEPNPTRWVVRCPLLRLLLNSHFRCPFPDKSAGGKICSVDLNINTKVQLETIILAKWHTPLSQMRVVNLISWGCLRSGFQAQGLWAFQWNNKLTLTSLRCDCRVVRASPCIDLKAWFPWKWGLFIRVELFGFN